MQNKAIGIFDSGVGGLTVFKAITDILPHESILYLGDTARVPYGTKSAETIVKYSIENADFLIKRGVKVLVVACNTSSAYSIPALRARNGIDVIGVIGPGAKAALKVTKNGHIGVIGTSSTIMSNLYAKELKAGNPDVKVISLPCPLFVPLVEEGWVDNEVTRAAAERYLTTLAAEGIDTLILGCTHYPLLSEMIRQVLGDEIVLVDSAKAVADELMGLLSEKRLLADESNRPEHHLYVTDLPARFELTAKRFLGETLPPVKLVEM